MIAFMLLLNVVYARYVAIRLADDSEQIESILGPLFKCVIKKN